MSEERTEEEMEEKARVEKRVSETRSAFYQAKAAWCDQEAKYYRRMHEEEMKAKADKESNT